MQNTVTLRVGSQNITFTQDVVIAKASTCDTSNLDQSNVQHGVVVKGKLYCVTTLARHIAGAPEPKSEAEVNVQQVRTAFRRLGFQLWSKQD